MKTPAKKKSSSVAGCVFDDIVKMRINPDDIMYLVEALMFCHSRGIKADWFTQIDILAERHPNDGLRVFCIAERMRCFSTMTKDIRMKGWSLLANDLRGDLTDGAVLMATANAPLYVHRQKLRFDADEFFARVLTISPSAGNA
jgi:hypothetical protein